MLAHSEQTSSPSDENGNSNRPGAGGAVSTSSAPATNAALGVLRHGGNAVDAAVAAAWALGVCEPGSSGLGGQTVMLIHRADGTAVVIDGHSYAPAAVSLATVDKRQQSIGYRACTVPSTPATLDYAQRKYGVLSRADVMTPAIRLADEGYPTTALQERQYRWVREPLRASEAASKLFLVKGEIPTLRYIFRQPELAQTLTRMMEAGVEDFYHGRLARDIADDMQRNGGLLSQQDLENCTLPVECNPISAAYRGFEVVSIPPPGGGCHLLFALKVLEEISRVTDWTDDIDWYEHIALATYSAFANRERHTRGLKDFSEELANELLSDANVSVIARELSSGNLPQYRRSAEGPGDTTHLTVADRRGNVVALTQSIKSLFGAKVANPKLGFVYNNYLRTCPRFLHTSQLRAGCCPRSNAAPTVVLRQYAGRQQPVMALGATGARRIISAMLHVMTSVLDRGHSLDEAVAAPRLHALLSRKLWVERPLATVPVLSRLGQHFTFDRILRKHSYSMGSVQAVHWLDDGMVAVAADPRREGLACAL
ncbi:MAG TPA: gamma-glutamyltransferase [Blastocatellia bacterium]|nr:gamma-glutamyltransferase [Blastocatellia bacterium]